MMRPKAEKLKLKVEKLQKKKSRLIKENNRLRSKLLQWNQSRRTFASFLAKKTSTIFKNLENMKNKKLITKSKNQRRSRNREKWVKLQQEALAMEAFALARMNSIFPKVDVFSSFRLEKIDSPVFLDSLEDSVSFSQKDVLFKTFYSEDYFYNNPITKEHSSIVKFSILRFYNLLKYLLRIYEIACPAVLDSDHIYLLMGHRLEIILTNQEKNSEFLNCLFCIYVLIVRFFGKEIRYIPKIDCDLLEELIVKTYHSNGVFTKKFDKFGNFDDLNFPGVQLNLKSKVEKIPDIDDFDSVESSDDEFVVIDYDL